MLFREKHTRKEHQKSLEKRDDCRSGNDDDDGKDDDESYIGAEMWSE